MLTDCVPTQLLAGPIVEFLVLAFKEPDGWVCTVRHRHASGRFTDCPELRWEDLDDETLVEVIAESCWECSAYSPRW